MLVWFVILVLVIYELAGIWLRFSFRYLSVLFQTKSGPGSTENRWMTAQRRGWRQQANTDDADEDMKRLVANNSTYGYGQNK